MHARYAGQLAAAAMLDPDIRRAYASRVRGYLAWLEHAGADGDPLTDPAARDGAVRDYRTWLQAVAGRKPATINAILAALADFYTRAGLGPPGAQRLDLPQRAPRPRRERHHPLAAYRRALAVPARPGNRKAAELTLAPPCQISRDLLDYLARSSPREV